MAESETAAAELVQALQEQLGAGELETFTVLVGDCCPGRWNGGLWIDRARQTVMLEREDEPTAQEFDRATAAGTPVEIDVNLASARPVAEDGPGFCSVCGMKLERGWSFCPGCGNTIPQDDALSPHRSNQTPVWSPRSVTDEAYEAAGAAWNALPKIQQHSHDSGDWEDGFLAGYIQRPDAVAFDGYRLVATVNGDVEVGCVHCPDLSWRYEPRVTNLLEVVQTVRNHNQVCPGRTRVPGPGLTVALGPVPDVPSFATETRVDG